VNEKSDKKIDEQGKNDTAEFVAKLDGKCPTQAEKAKAIAKDVAARLDPEHINSFSDLIVVRKILDNKIKIAMKQHELRDKNGKLF
jgi:hypothetical protein